MKRIIFSFALVLITWLVGHAQGGSSLTEAKYCPIIQSVVVQVNPDSIRSYMQVLQDFGTRFCLAGNRRAVSMWIKNKFASFGISEVKLDSFQLNMTFMGQLHETWQYNVVATIAGLISPDSIVILGAHHDSVCYNSSVQPPGNPWQCSLDNAPGADDNASGVAAALEAARLLQSINYQPKKTIKFVTFAAEEVGLRGAWHFANKAATEGMKIKAMINNDMISNCTLPVDQWKLRVHGYPGAEWLSGLATALINNYTVFEAIQSSQSLNATDSYAFHQNGFPALFLHEGQFSPVYHSVNDVVENTNKEYATEATKVSVALLMHLNGTNQWLQVNEPTDCLLNVAVFPNPVNHKATVRFSIREAQTVSVRVFDAIGKVMLEGKPIKLNPGNHQIEVDITGLPIGLYLFSISSEIASKTIKVVKK